MSDDNFIQLSLEQEFSLAMFKKEASELSEEGARRSLVNLYKHLLIREATFQQLLRARWGIER